MKKDEHVLIVGQTPPPFHGQAVMIEALVKAHYRNAIIHHVPMAFSRTADEVGRASGRKVFHLLKTIARIIGVRIRHRRMTLYYPPASPNLTPVVRDVILLASTRWMFARVIYHFHAGGLGEYFRRAPRVLRLLMRLAYGRADVGAVLGERLKDDSETLRCRETVVIPYGVPDVSGPATPRIPGRILYVGMLHESKGVLDLLTAFDDVRSHVPTASLMLVGAFSSAEFETRVRRFVADHGLTGAVSFAGVLTGYDKEAAFAQASVFAFPTYYEAENLPVVIIEALRAGLPVVSSRWRGVPAMIDDGVEGYLLERRDIAGVAGKLRTLLTDEALAVEMGRRSRKRYEADFTFNQYIDRFGELFASPH